MATQPSTTNNVDLVTAANNGDPETQQPGVVSQAAQAVQVQGSDQPSEPISAAAVKDIQQQLMILVHARLCRRNFCTLLQCESMKNLLTHMAQCQAEMDCTVPLCVSSTQMISHWNHCTRGDCKICVPLRALKSCLPVNVLNLAIQLEI